MSSGHLHVHLGDGSVEGSVSVLLVHVNDIISGQISQENSVVSDGSALLLEDLAGGDDFTLNLSDLVLSLHVVPELGTSQNSVTLENSHSVKLWVWGILSWEGTSHNVELSNLEKKSKLEISQS